MLAGAVAMNGMVVLSDGADFVGCIQRSGCVAVILDPKQKHNPLSVLESRNRFRAGHTVDCPDAPLLKTLLFVHCGAGQEGHKPFLEQLRNENESFVADVQPEDRATIFTTSGSTGFSKLIPRTHAEYLAIGEAISKLFVTTKNDDILMNSDVFGWGCGSPGHYAVTGITRICFDHSIWRDTDDRTLWEKVSSERCTIALFLPATVERTLSKDNVCEGLNIKLRVIATGGQPIRKRYLDLIGKVTESLAIVYGSTECSFLTMKLVDLNNMGDYEDGNNGLPLPGMEIKLVDENQQEVVEPGQTGEVMCRGPIVFNGYLGMDQAAQSNVFTHDGWFRTTDVGFRNRKGELHIICRKSNAIIYGGMILYPGWLESRLARCPGVQSVVIVPVPDPIKYQELCACVVRQPGVNVMEEDVCEFCKTVYLDPESVVAAVPRYYLFYDSFPTTMTGKTDRKAVLTSALRTLGMTHTQPTVVTSNTQ